METNFIETEFFKGCCLPGLLHLKGQALGYIERVLLLIIMISGYLKVLNSGLYEDNRSV